MGNIPLQDFLTFLGFMNPVPKDILQTPEQIKSNLQSNIDLKHLNINAQIAAYSIPMPPLPAPRVEIKDFDKKRDLEFIRDAFNKDRYWLVEDPDFSIDSLVNPKADPFGVSYFKVLFQNDKPAGFITYNYRHKLAGASGDIDIMYVDPNFRNKGYGRRLTKYAADELFKMGAPIVQLFVRTSNIPAIKTYTSLGFKGTPLVRRYYFQDPGFSIFHVTKDALK